MDEFAGSINTMCGNVFEPAGVKNAHISNVSKGPTTITSQKHTAKNNGVSKPKNKKKVKRPFGSCM